MDRNELLKLIDGELSSTNALNWATDMTRFYRSPGSSGYHQATEYVQGLFHRAGVDMVWEERYPLDGETKLMGEAVPLSWEPVSAEMRAGSPSGRVLMSYDTAFSCLPWWSPSTPEGGAMFEVVDVGTGERPEDYAGKDLQGKAAFVRGTPRVNGWTHAATLAMERGAAGVITDYLLYQDMPTRTRESLPNAVQLLRMPSSRPSAWGMSVDHHAAERLKAMAANGESIWVNIQTKTFEGEGVNLLAEITGTDLSDESVLFVTHSTAGTKPGANCSSGPSLAAEIARTVTTLVSSGRVPRPRRTIRFLTDVEGHGSKHYMQHHADDLRKTVSVIALDSVGHSQQKLDSELLYFRSPDSVPTFLNDLIAGLIDDSPKDGPWVYSTDKMVSNVNFSTLPYTPWSDNKYYPAFGVPAGLFMSWPDRFFHTQLLTADNLDPAVFRRCGIVAAAAALTIAGAGAEDAIEIMREVSHRSQNRIGRTALRYGRTEDPGRLARRLRYLANIGQAAVESASALTGPADEGHDDAVTALQALTSDIAERAERESARFGAEGATLTCPGGDAVPRRLAERSAPGLAGTAYLDLVAITGEMSGRDPRFNFHAIRIVGDEMWNLTDGERSVNEIAEQIGFEFEYDIDPAHVLTLFEGLERAGLVGFGV